MTTAPGASEGRTAAPSTQVIHNWIKDTGSDIHGTPFASGFPCGIGFQALTNSTLSEWGWIAYQTAVDRALCTVNHPTHFRQQSTPFQRTTWLANYKKPGANRMEFPRSWPIGSPFPPLGPIEPQLEVMPNATPDTPAPFISIREPETNEEMEEDPSDSHKNDASWPSEKPKKKKWTTQPAARPQPETSPCPPPPQPPPARPPENP